MRNAEKALEQAKREKANANVKQADQNLSKGGYSTSDEIIDEADPVLEILGEFYQRYQRLGEFIDMPLLDPADRYTPSPTRASGHSTGRFSPKMRSRVVRRPITRIPGSSRSSFVKA